MRFQRLLLSLVILFGITQTATAAALEWTATTLELKPEPGASTAAGAFSFVNPGPGPVSINSATPSCNCVTAAADARTYESGQAGTISIAVDLRGLNGVQEKTVSVLAVGETDQRTVLHVRVVIPELVLISPPVLTWSHGEKPATKLLIVGPGTSIPIKLTGFFCDDANFTAPSEPIDDGRRFRLRITPQVTSSPRHATLRIQTLTEAQKSETRTAYLIVQ